MNLMKLGAGIAGVSGASGIGILGAYYSGVFSTNKNTIQEKLKRNKWTILEDSKSEHKSHWSTSLTKYKSKHSGNENLTETQLKKICSDLLKKEDDDSYEEARKYCVVPNKVSERLEKLGFTLLDISTSGSSSNPNQTQWTSLATKYKTKGVESKELDTLKANTINDNGANWHSLKDKCKEVSEKDHWSDKYESLVNNSKTWCTMQGFEGISSL
ncbi:hypothetical protein MHC_03515 [Mycoplasma haemocanis str. Illinois]|uniref:Uncharacterized protein n=1 Tax=Mycoplasma haemocanis (strain Illinois) TaxID=1111676 RepID=H6N7E1_MYCHN|nr:hypothetical protein [Mycoplasma haemocanis]AEW45563.2 hypothetical protein MHC_03515 [Mycoplasma haemocanis str. Illinois]